MLGPMKSPADLAKAIHTARRHIPIQQAVDTRPSGFAICDEGNRFGVYARDNWEHGQAPGGFLPPGKPLRERFKLAGFVGLDGVFTAANGA